MNVQHSTEISALGAAYLISSVLQVLGSSPALTCASFRHDMRPCIHMSVYCLAPQVDTLDGAESHSRGSGVDGPGLQQLGVAG